MNKTGGRHKKQWETHPVMYSGKQINLKEDKLDLDSFYIIR